MSDALPLPAQDAPNLTPTGGEDTLDVGVFVDFTEGAWEPLIAALDKAKAAAQDAEAPETDEWIKVGELPLQVFDKGFGKKNAVFYHWVIEALGIKLAIANRRVPDDYTSRANVRVQVGSMVLMRDGIGVVWETAKALIASLGGTVKGNKISRVDMALDLPGCPIAAFAGAVFENRLVTRADNGKIHFKISGFQVGTLYIGSGKFLARLYDKVAEVRTSRDEAKWAVLKEKRWHGVDQETATRVEFEISREGLKEVGVDSMEDWLHLRPAVAEYLTGAWLRIAAEPVMDRKRGDLAKM